MSPACQCGLVTVKPTVGLVSRAGIVPIAHSQDTAGPLTRTVHDAAMLLNVLAVADPLDPATAGLRRPADYTSALDRDGLRGTRIGVPSDPADPGNDVYYGPLPPRTAAVMARAIEAAADLGATVVRANMPTAGWIGGPGTEIAILNRNRESRTSLQPVRRSLVSVYELKHDLELYLRDWASETGMRSLADIVAFNEAHTDRTLRFGQDVLLAAAATRGDLSEPEYIAARQSDLRSARTLGLDAYMEGTGSTRYCFRGRPAPRSPPRPVIRASRSPPALSAATTPRNTRSAPPSPAAPGASPPCCASPTPSRKRPKPAARRRAFRRSVR